MKAKKSKWEFKHYFLLYMVALGFLYFFFEGTIEGLLIMILAYVQYIASGLK